ncbi:uncharacterized protein G2W53_013545 [Senna tora]|uniref:Uncharacterized protein n=1 Tax=Senna tora TaxID=362788 RepID=A0A834TZE7_9FABA|nr:uncharacterized protein G2W53_013545 [Senna tora]
MSLLSVGFLFNFEGTNEILMRVRTRSRTRIRTDLNFVLFNLQCLLLFLPFLNAQPLFPLPSSGVSARSLDALLQDYAFRAFFRPRTGVPYDGAVPSNLTGISVSAMRLRSGSLRIRGVDRYKEFQIPIGVVEQPYVERLVLVYHNLGNWSDQFYPLPGYTYLAPVLGLLAYSAANLSASELPELDIRASDKPILIKFPDVKSSPSSSSSSPKCVYFDLQGSVQFDMLLPGNVCSTVKQGHFSIVVEESSPPSPSPSPSPSPRSWGEEEEEEVRRSKKDTKIQKMEWAAESNENLQIASIGGTKAPLALGTRTRPVIETDYIP